LGFFVEGEAAILEGMVWAQHFGAQRDALLGGDGAALETHGACFS
jgi:hypothetical protein